jgi:hypothetical protein
MVFLGGGVIAVLLVLGGVFFAYKKFTAVPPEPSPRPKVAAKPRNQEASVPAMVAKAKQEAAAPINEILPPAPAVVAGPAAPAKSVATPPAPLAVPGPAVVAPPPPASAPFKAWVENLRIGGVRAGATTRVFIGGTAYAAGELVNPQLGIVFDSYNPETRRLTFKDKTGATVERRN